MAVFGILCLVLAIILFYLGGKKLKEAAQLQNNYTKEVDLAREELSKIQKEREKILIDKSILLNEISTKKDELYKTLEDEKNKLSNEMRKYQSSTSYAAEQYMYTLEKRYVEVEKEFDEKMKILTTEEEDAKAELAKLKATLSAGVEAQLREKEKEENLDYYKLKLNKNDLSDIQALNQIKSVLHQPVILSKLIWSTYFQKQTTELCNRILGLNKKCGIYKITNINTQQCYIGQSVDVSTRWKDHVKCGLGIDASATNKLYNAMQEEGVWNFTFELIEECARELLNEKEKFWINMYQADKFGYNSTKGNK